MRTIRKFPIAISNYQHVELPQSAKILKAAEQDGLLYIWVLLDPNDKDLFSREIRVYGTGNNIPAPDPLLSHIDTVLMSDGLVWHVFEEVN